MGGWIENKLEWKRKRNGNGFPENTKLIQVERDVQMIDFDNIAGNRSRLHISFLNKIFSKSC